MSVTNLHQLTPMKDLLYKEVVQSYKIRVNS